MWFLNSPTGYTAAVGQINQTTSPHVNMAAIRRMAVSLPPSREQHRIVAKIDGLMMKLDRLAQHLTNKKAAHDAFAAAAVHRLEP